MKPKYIICYVEENSPAQEANVVGNDILIKINDKNIRKEKFESVRDIVSNALKAGKIELLLISMDGYKVFKDKKYKFSDTSKFITSSNTEYFSNKGFFFIHSNGKIFTFFKFLAEQYENNYENVFGNSTKEIKKLV